METAPRQRVCRDRRRRPLLERIFLVVVLF
jgi:hypothetical protein